MKVQLAINLKQKRRKTWNYFVKRRRIYPINLELHIDKTIYIYIF